VGLALIQEMIPSPFAVLVEQARQAPPEMALVLGSGLGAIARRLEVACQVRFEEVPGLVGPSISGHSGRLLLGDWAGRRVLIFEGRLHYYEGHPWQRVVHLVRLARSLGARRLVATNAAGGIRDDLSPGSLMALRDHLDWTQPYCWRRPGLGGLGPARPSPYSPRLLHQLMQSAQALGIPLSEGTYAAVTGPSYETPAEIRALRALGADAVGMSTAREIEAGQELEMECAGLSCITNRAAGLAAGPVQHGEVLATAAAQSERLAELLERFVQLV
jgi:purine-nucleoside phosphorylase